MSTVRCIEEPAWFTNSSIISCLEEKELGGKLEEDALDLFTRQNSWEQEQEEFPIGGVDGWQLLPLVEDVTESWLVDQDYNANGLYTGGQPLAAALPLVSSQQNFTVHSQQEYVGGEAECAGGLDQSGSSCDHYMDCSWLDKAMMDELSMLASHSVATTSQQTFLHSVATTSQQTFLPSNCVATANQQTFLSSDCITTSRPMFLTSTLGGQSVVVGDLCATIGQSFLKEHEYSMCVEESVGLESSLIGDGSCVAIPSTIELEDIIEMIGPVVDDQISQEYSAAVSVKSDCDWTGSGQTNETIQWSETEVIPTSCENSDYSFSEDSSEDDEFVPFTKTKRSIKKRVKRCSVRREEYARLSLSQRRERKKEQNKNAATKYREKKRSEEVEKESLCDVLERRNHELKREVADKEQEVKLLRKLVINIFRPSAAPSSKKSKACRK